MDLDASWINFNCLKCQYSIEVQLIEVQLQSIIFCHNCKTSIQLLDENASTYSGTKQINDTIKSLEKVLKNFGK